MNVLLSESVEPITAALERLMRKNEWYHPFVVIEKVGRPDLFVQFATNATVLLFDVPLLGIVLEPCRSPALGAQLAIARLRNLGVRDDERILINEEDDKKSGRGEPFWRKALAWLRPKNFASG